MRAVRQWLEQLGLVQYAEVFERNAVDLSIARDLTQEDLRSLGVEPLGHRKILSRAIAELNGAQAAAPQAQGIHELLPTQRSLPVDAERRQLTVLFCDFVSFTQIAEQLSPEQLVSRLDSFFRSFDEIVARNNVEKIKNGIHISKKKQERY